MVNEILKVGGESVGLVFNDARISSSVSLLGGSLNIGGCSND